MIPSLLRSYSPPIHKNISGRVLIKADKTRLVKAQFSFRKQPLPSNRFYHTQKGKNNRKFTHILGNKNPLRIPLSIAGLLFASYVYAQYKPTKVTEKLDPIQEASLSKEQINFFHKHGYLIVKALFNPKEVSGIQQHFKEVFDRSKVIAKKTKIDQNIKTGDSFRCTYNGKASIKAISSIDGSVSIMLISWIGGIKPELLNLARQSKVTIPVSQLLESSTADHLINQVHYKIPFDNVVFEWHQDMQNRRRFDPNWKDINGKGSFVQVLTAIDKVTEENGPLIIVKNSHKKDLHLERQSGDTIESIIDKEYPDESWTPVLMEPGDTLFMHPLLLHKSNANTSNNPRMMFINGFSYPGANKEPYPGAGSSKTIRLVP